MNYRQQDVLLAFRLYAKLVERGLLTGDEANQYIMNEEIRGLLELFAIEVDCILAHTSDALYLVPKTGLSPFHIKNEALRRELGSQATNADLYMMYFCILIFIGEFYNSYQSLEAQRDFLTLSDWLTKINDRIETLQAHGADELKREEQDFQYNWTAILEKWEALNDIKESAAKQKGKTISRISFLDKVIHFLLDQQLIIEIGEEEYTLTEKCKVIVQRYFMELEYNRGILQFMYQYDERKEESDALHIQN